MIVERLCVNFDFRFIRPILHDGIGIIEAIEVLVGFFNALQVLNWVDFSSLRKMYFSSIQDILRFFFVLDIFLPQTIRAVLR